ncbi:MAG TPA: hypothetical protein ENJ99_05690 [Rhizobiales bacterium]|nr:hypothetical protein [Hyphomicrobiales bacterium]
MKKLMTGVVCALAMVSFAAAAQAAKYKEIKVVNGGSVSGKVSAGSVASKTKTFTISKDPKICGDGTRDVKLVEVSNGVVKNAVVYLSKIKEGKAFPDALKNVTLDQKGCTFVPAFSVMANKGKLTAVNDDGTLHNIHTYELIGKARRTIFNVSQPNAGDKVTKKIKMRKGVGMKIECDAHDFMHGYMFVAKNPYFAVVNDKGEFKISDIPPGEYKINLWQGFLGNVKSGKVKVTAGGDTRIDLSF